jgi:GntR family transcriptional regulator, uxu operon transcriptional repressor
VSEPDIGKAAQRAVEELQRRIRSGLLGEGQQLPPERVLSSELGVARNTLRKALAHLESSGEVTRRIGSGTFVKANGAIANSTLPSKMRHASPAELMEVRLIIEPQAAAMAASRASAEDLKAIDSALTSSLIAKSLAEFEHWDAQLHLLVFKATRNSVLIDYCQAINAIRNEPEWYALKKRTVNPDTRRIYDRQHSAIVSALRERDPDRARRCMAEHLGMVRDNLMGAI